MNKLLHAGLYQIKRDKLFWISLAGVVISGIVFGISTVSGGAFDDMFLVPEFVILGIYLSLFIGREYSDGTIRNKIIVGHTKGNIFLSKLILSFMIASLMFLIFTTTFTIISCKEVLSKIPFYILLEVGVGFFLMHLSFAAIFTVVSSLIPSKTVGAVASMVLIVAMMFASYQFEFALGQSKVIGIEKYDENDVLIEVEEYDNPHYIDGIQRTIYQIADNTLPHGQINSYVSYLSSCLYAPFDDVEVDYELIKSDYAISEYPYYSLGLIVVLSGIGFIAFRKKEFK